VQVRPWLKPPLLYHRRCSHEVGEGVGLGVLTGVGLHSSKALLAQKLMLKLGNSCMQHADNVVYRKSLLLASYPFVQVWTWLKPPFLYHRRCSHEVGEGVGGGVGLGVSIGTGLHESTTLQLFLPPPNEVPGGLKPLARQHDLAVGYTSAQEGGFAPLKSFLHSSLSGTKKKGRPRHDVGAGETGVRVGLGVLPRVGVRVGRRVGFGVGSLLGFDVGLQMST